MYGLAYYIQNKLHINVYNSTTKESMFQYWELVSLERKTLCKISRSADRR